ncbi:MAG: sulfotransferase family protein [Erythrobacter sp.]|jgi:hypothetical protein|nr:sulfotransferase family protein [Erythrobacter sp.]
MALEVIAAGLGRNATFSMKFALEKLGFGPCHHMVEVLADGSRQVPLWIEAANGNPDWDAIFAGFRATSDYPSASYWRELAAHYPAAKVVLTTRDPDSWFESVSETIFSEGMQAGLVGTPPGEMMHGTIFSHFGDGDIRDRAFMTAWYERRNQEVIDTIPPERLLVFHPKQGWEPLCEFLGVEVPPVKFPKVNSRDEISAAADAEGGMPADPAAAERWAREYMADLAAKAFV